MSVSINGDTGISGVNGSAATPAIQGGDADTGIFFGTDTASISTGGSSRLTVDSSGRVGIGSTSPSNILSLDDTNAAGGIGLDITNQGDGGTSTAPYVFISANLNPTRPGGEIRFIREDVYGSAATADSVMAFYTAENGVNNEVMRIDSEKRLFIGSTAERDKWNNTTIAANRVQLERAGNGKATAISIVANSGTVQTPALSCAARLLLGRTRGTTPGAENLVQSGDTIGDLSFQGSDGTGFVECAAIQSIIDEAADENEMPGRIIFRTTPAGSGSSFERMRINRNGNVGIGTFGSSVANSDPTAPLHIRRTSTYSNGLESIVFQKYSHKSSSDLGRQTSFIEFDFTDGNLNEIPQVKFGAQVGPSTEADSQIKEGQGAFLVFTNNATSDGDPNTSPTGMSERLRVDYLGRLIVPAVYSNTTASGSNVHVNSGGLLRRSTSSIKYKKDVETLEDNYADAVLGCRPVWYRSTSDGDNPNYGWWGFIAEEVAEIDPRLVHYKTTERVITDDGLAEFAPCDPVPEAVAYERFVPHLLNLLQRQKSAIETLEQRLSDAGIA